MIAWLKKNWRAVVKAALAILAIVGFVGVIRQIVGHLGIAVLGQPGATKANRVWWDMLPGETKRIVVKVPDGWKTVDLPAGVTADHVKAAAYDGANVTVEKVNPAFGGV
jgi:hypothetical protein